MIRGIDHIGLATQDAAGVGPFLSALGMHRGDAGLARDYGVTCEFWQFDQAGQPAIETVCPSGPDSAVTRYLEKKGAGLYHVAFEVDDIELELARLRGEGFVAIDERPRAGARVGMQVAFMYLRRPADLLIELVQYAHQHR